VELHEPADTNDEALGATDVMRRRHAAVQTQPATIAMVVGRAAGQRAAEIERIVRGYESEVYLVTTAAGERLVVRIRRYGSVSYASEAWAIASCRSAGAPVPEILLVDTLSLDGDEREVMVQRAVPGRPLSDVQDALSRDELAHVWAQAGEALARIHSVPAGGFYKMRQPGVWDFPNGASVTHSAWEARQSDMDELRQRGVPGGDLEALEALLHAAENAFPLGQPWLLHGDFLPGHLFVDDALRLRGVIDFGDFQGGPRINDLANLRMSAPQVDLEWLRAGYGEQEPFDAHLERRLLLTGAEMQVGYLAHYLREGNDAEAALVLRAIRATADAWRADR
jgi:aminoglycoside phosphotransferase (APT) family kinase protein